MAIATFESSEEVAPWGDPRAPGRPALRLVGVEPVGGDGRELADVTPIDARRALVRHGEDVSRRRAARRQAQVRRRRLGLALLTLGLLACLALPVGLLGGSNPDTAATALANTADAGSGVVYVVQPGDTLESIAARVDPGHAGRMVHLLARETGSATVVPGEHITLP